MGNKSSSKPKSDDVEQQDFVQMLDEQISGGFEPSIYTADSSELWVLKPSSCCSYCLLCLCKCQFKRQRGMNRKQEKYRIHQQRKRQNKRHLFCCRATENYCDQRQSLTQQSDEETLVNSTINSQREMIAQPHVQIAALEQQIEELKNEKELLLTRLSQISSVHLTEGNPNIADLSDPNRPDKVAEQFSELYDNQWTDSFEALCKRRGLQEENAINALLKIILTAYEVCRSQAENQNRQLMESMCLFTGVEVRDGGNESIIRESMHNLRNFRAKHFSSSMADINKKIEDSLQSTIGSDVCSDCQGFIAECTKVCWLMCIKSPLMYIEAKKTENFDHNLYTSYTKSGKHMSYVVWPTLFQYENGPIMKKRRSTRNQLTLNFCS